MTAVMNTQPRLEPLEEAVLAEGATADPTPERAPGLEAESVVARRPSFVFLGIVAAVALGLDVASKAAAELVLTQRSPLDPSIVLIPDTLSFTLAYNQGGAWGLLQDAGESVRRPFFLVVSIAAVLFIVSLYSRLGVKQWALKWGLPMVLGGALGNLADRVIRGSVVDFIDYQASWVRLMNEGIAKLVPSWHVTDHWPTFNVADIAICVGVGLMVVDMFVAKRAPSSHGAAASLPER
jgi:signal peptidase II